MSPPSSHSPSGLRWLSAGAPGAGAIVLFHYAAGTALVWSSLAAQLAPHAVATVQMAGRLERLNDPLSASLADDARLLAAELLGAPQPLVFYGHSLGGHLAYATARQLEDAGGTVAHLVVGAVRPPTRAPLRPLHGLPDDEFLAGLRQLGGGATAAAIEEPEIVAMMLPTWRNDFRLAEQGAGITGPVRCPLTAVTAVDDYWYSVDLVAAWRELTSAAFRLEVLDGDDHLLCHSSEAELRAILLDVLSASRS